MNTKKDFSTKGKATNVGRDHESCSLRILINDLHNRLIISYKTETADREKVIRKLQKENNNLAEVENKYNELLQHARIG